MGTLTVVRVTWTTPTSMGPFHGVVVANTAAIAASCGSRITPAGLIPKLVVGAAPAGQESLWAGARSVPPWLHSGWGRGLARSRIVPLLQADFPAPAIPDLEPYEPRTVCLESRALMARRSRFCPAG